MKGKHLEAVAEAIADNLASQSEVADVPDRYVDWIYPDELAAAAVDALRPPDRVFVDNFGQRWEWRGGEEGTWAWRRTADAIQFTEESVVLNQYGACNGDPEIRQCRLVGPWVVQPEAVSDE